MEACKFGSRKNKLFISMYNTYVHDTYRRIIIVIDELAEILDKKRFPKAQHARIDNIIGYLSIIACTGRAFGVHLILGTQRRSAVRLNQKQRHKKEEIRTHLPQGRISSDFLHLVRPTRFAPPGHKLRTVSGNKNAHPGWGGYFYVVCRQKRCTLFAFTSTSSLEICLHYATNIR